MGRRGFGFGVWGLRFRVSGLGFGRLSSERKANKFKLKGAAALANRNFYRENVVSKMGPVKSGNEGGLHKKPLKNIRRGHQKMVGIFVS